MWLEKLMDYLGFCMLCSTICISPKDSSKASKHLKLGDDTIKVIKTRIWKEGMQRHHFEQISRHN